MKVNEFAKTHIIENHVSNAFLLKKIATGYKIVWISKSYLSLFSLFADPIDRNEANLNQLFSHKYLSYTNKQNFKMLLNSCSETGKTIEMAPFKIYKTHDPEHFQYFKPVNFPIKDEKNNSIYVLHKLINISPEGKQEKDQVNNDEKHFEIHPSFFLNHPHPLCKIDQNGIIQEVNLKWKEYGAKLEVDDNSEYLPDFFPSQLKSSLLNFLKQLGKTAKTFETKTDRISILKINFYPLSNQSNIPNYLVEYQDNIAQNTTSLPDEKDKSVLELFTKIHQKINEGISPLKKINKTMDLLCQNFEIAGLWYADFNGSYQSSTWILHQNRNNTKKIELSHKAASIFKAIGSHLKTKPQKILIKNLDNKDLSEYLSNIGIASIFHIPVFQHNALCWQCMLFQVNPENRIKSTDLLQIQLIMGLIAPLNNQR
jgi:hypothetical protein